MSQIPPEYKKLAPYLVHSKQMRNADPLLSYYCSLYALTECIKIRSASPAAKQWLASLMDETEELKASLGDLVGKNQQEYVLVAAMRIFVAADADDRAGKATKQTAQSYFASANFFDVGSQFGPLPEKTVSIRTHCKVRAAAIMKALKEGHPPEPLPPIQQQQPQPQPQPQPQTDFNPSFEQPQQQPMNPSFAPSQPQQQPQMGLSYDGVPEGKKFTIQEGPKGLPPDFSKPQKLCKEAASSIDSGNVTVAIQKLEEALKQLTGQDFVTV